MKLTSISLMAGGLMFATTSVKAANSMTTPVNRYWRVWIFTTGLAAGDT